MRFKDLPGQSCPVCNGGEANEKQNHPLHWTFAVQERKATQTGSEHNAELLRGKDVSPEPNLAQLQAAIALLRRFLFVFCKGEALRLFSAGRAFLHIISALTVSHSPYNRLSLADSQLFRRLGGGHADAVRSPADAESNYSLDATWALNEYCGATRVGLKARYLRPLS